MEKREILKPRKHENAPSYYLKEDIEKMMSPEEIKKFADWFVGQTDILVDGECGYYAHDVQRFLDKVLKGKPTYWD